MRDSVLSTWKTKFNDTPTRQPFIGLQPSHDTQQSVHRDSALMRKYQLTQGFLCELCVTQYERQKLSSYYDEDEESMSEEEMDLIGFDLNPDMEEEKYCNSCSKKRKNTTAVCLSNGQPSCLECLNKAGHSYEESNISSIYGLNDSGVDNNSKSAQKKFAYKRMMSEAHSISKISDRIKSVEFNKIEAQNNGLKNKLNKANISMNLNNLYQEEEPKMNQLTPSNAKKRLSIFEYSNKEINSKIMNLVSPRNSVDLKFRKNLNLNQIEKICKSLDYIFENSSQKVIIHLPFIYDGSKSVNEIHWNKKLDSNGNYLFTFLDSREEFLFGLVCNTFSDKKIAKLFKKIQDIGKSKSSIEYSDHIFESITITEKLLLIDGYLSYEIENKKLSLDNNKLIKFFMSSQSRQDMTSQINIMNIYDMC
jgi:hypothetical protein